MKRLVSLAMALTVWVALPESTRAAATDALDAPEDATVKIALTKFDLSEAALQLSWKIRNDTDRDVWVCTGVSLAGKSGIDRLSDKDGRTLLLRGQFDLPRGVGWEHMHRGYYTRLRPGQESAESYSLALPVFPSSEFGYSYAHGDYADRLALEIGYYDEDLPRLILDVVRAAEKLSCDVTPTPESWDSDAMELVPRFFPGWRITQTFYGESFKYFRDSVTSGGDEIVLPHMEQVLRGEKVLRITIDGVSLPYEGGTWPKKSD